MRVVAHRVIPGISPQGDMYTCTLPHQLRWSLRSEKTLCTHDPRRQSEAASTGRPSRVAVGRIDRESRFVLAFRTLSGLGRSLVHNKGGWVSDSRVTQSLEVTHSPILHPDTNQTSGMKRAHENIAEEKKNSENPASSTHSWAQRLALIGKQMFQIDCKVERRIIFPS